MEKRPRTVHLGFEVGTGEPVEIPVGHMVITGQTQLAGKTTTLEALIARSALKAVAFVTKRGEGSFASAHRLPPYFRERADWQFVASILESVMREKMKFERAWIVRAAHGARSLADVRRNVKRLQEKARGGMNADMYMLLGEYLDLVVPMVEKLPAAAEVDLRDGINVMDLGAYPTELQALVIRSVLEWVYERENDAVTIIPEAWEFVPQTRGSPVKLAATSLVRKGAVLRNFIWLDSQDIAGVEKEILRSASVWLLGVQREANEIKRALEHIPAGIKKPRASDVATLGRGQFFACWGTHAVKTYIQPSWMASEEARAISGGAPQQTSPPAAVRVQTDGYLGDRPSLGTALLREQPTYSGKFEDLDPRPLLATARAVKLPDRWPAPPPKEDDMTPAQEKKLDTLIEAVTALTKVVGKPVQVQQKFDDADPDRTTERMLSDVARKKGSQPIAGPPVADEEATYQRFVARLRAEAPALIRVLAEVPEIELSIERQTIQVDGKSLRGKIARLIADGWFDAGKRNGELKTELDRVGFSSAPSNNLRELKELASLGFFTVEGDRFKAVPGMKVNVVER